MFNATQTYKDLLIKRLEEDKDCVMLCSRSQYQQGYINALSDVISIICDNDIPPVVQEPIKTKCKAYCPDDKIKSLDC